MVSSSCYVYLLALLALLALTDVLSSSFLEGYANSVYQVEVCKKNQEICMNSFGLGALYFAENVDQIGYTYDVVIANSLFRTNPGCKLSHQSSLIEVDNH